MIKITMTENVERVFDAQQLATLKGFGDALDFEGPGVCSKTVECGEHPLGEFFCTRVTGHPGVHVAMGLGVAAVWDGD